MKNQIIILFILILTSCSSPKQASICESSFNSSSLFQNEGIIPIELIREGSITRIWIERSSSMNQILTIAQDTSGIYAEFVEVGFHYKRDKKIAYFSKTEICPINGWNDFFIELDSINLKSLVSRKNDPSTDGIIMHHPMSRYLVEIKNEFEIKKFEFYSFYPSQNFPEDMKKYSELEKLILTSFKPLVESLKFSQDCYKNLGPFKY
ncbi:MAG: hypothetical protein QNK23_11340 [Crocinitomicaceae bacterium]|nr:hypothetical protein [Crocinitomicaceae bacterium]